MVLIEGVAERVVGLMNIDGVPVDARVGSSPSTASGLSKRSVVLEEGIAQVNSDVSGIAERTVVLEQGINLSTEFYYRPDDNDVNVDYSDENIVISLIPYVAGRGLYYKTNAQFRVISSGGYRLEEDSQYRVWEQNNGDGTYDIIAYNSPFSSWDIWYNQSSSITTKSDNDALSGSPLDLAISEGLFGPGSKVTSEGVAEREIDTNEQVQALQAGSSSTGIADGLPHNAVPGATIRKKGDQAQPAQVAGVAERTVDQDVSGVVVDDALNASDASIVVQANIGYLSRETALQAGSSLEAQPTQVTGVAERIIEQNNATGELVAQSISATGLSERIIENNAVTQAFKPTDNNLVTGVAERQIDFVSLEQVAPSEVTGLAERTINFVSLTQVAPSEVTGLAERIVEQNNATGELVAQSSTLVSVSERIIENNEVTQALKPTDNNLVTGVAERQIDFVSLEQVAPSEVTGLSERTINGTGAVVSESTTVGLAERTSKGSGVLASQSSATVGVSERVLVAAGAISTQSSSTSGIAERAVTGTASLQDQSVQVTGVAEREVPAPSGALHAGLSSIDVQANRSYTTSAELNDNDANIVGGQSERAVTLIVGEDASGELRPTLHHLVTGEAERIITANGSLVTTGFVIVCDAGLLYNASGDLKPTDNNLVTGEGETLRVAAGDLESPDHIIGGLAERIITGEGEFTVSDCIATGVAERIITEVEADLTADEVGVAAVTGDSERLIPANGAMKTTTSVVAGLGIRVSNGSGVLETDTSVVSGISERIVTGAGDLVPTDNHLVSGLSEREIRSSADLKPTDNNLVVGSGNPTRGIDGTLQAAEHFVFAITVVERVATGALQTATSVVTGTAENEVAAGSVAIRAGLSSVDAVTQVTRNGSGVLDSLTESLVSGISERIVTAVGTLEAQSSSTTGEAENIVPATGSLQSAASIIAGVAERTVVEIEADLTADEVGVVAISGDAERLITEDEAAPAAQSSIVTGLVERTVEGIGVLEDGSSTVVALAELSKTGTGTLDTIESVVTGVAERTVNGSGVLDSTSSLVVSASERIITGAGDLVPTVNNLVNGLAEREAVAGTGALQDRLSRVVVQANIGRVTSPDLKPTDNNLVAGLGERTVVLIYGILGNYYPSQRVDISGVAERIVDTNDTTQALDTGPSEVDGVAERIITSTGSLDTTVSVVDGLSERIVEDNNITAHLVQSESLVDGLAERTINLFESPQAQPSTVVGEAERTVEDNGASHALVSGSSTLHCVAERIIENNAVTQALKPTDNNLVTGVAERFVSKQFFTDPEAQPSEVEGLAERIVVLEEGIAQGSESEVTGLAERTVVEIEADLTADEVGVFAVTGESERLIPGDGELENVSSVVDGLAERIINTFSGIEQGDVSEVEGLAERIITVDAGIAQGSPSVVTGVAERTIEVNTLNQALTTTESLVDGLAERTINTFSGIEQGDVSVVDGLAERIIENNEITQALGVVDAEVDGLAERIIVLESSDHVKASDTDVITNGGTPITIDRHPIGGDVYPEYRSDLQGGQPDMVMDGDRKITQETDGLEDHAHYGPNSSDPNVSYTGPNDKNLRISGINANYDNVYELLAEGYTIATEDDGYQLTAYEEYNIYYWRNRSAGYNEYRICAYRTTNDTWAVFETTLNPELFFTDGLVIPDSIFTSRTVAFSSQSKNGPIKRLTPSEFNVVVGDADKVHENYQTPSELESGPSTIEGRAFIGHNSITGDAQADPSIVVGAAERIIVEVEADLSAEEVGVVAITGDAERLIVGNGSLETAHSVVEGVAENTITFVDGITQDSPSEVDGLAERIVTATGALDTTLSTLNSVAERTTSGSGAIISDGSHVDATVKRTVVSLLAELHDLPSSISSAAGDGDRKVVVAGRDVYSGPSVVTGTVERTVHGSGELECESIVSGIAERHAKGSGVLDNSTDSVVDGTSERKIVSITANLTTTESVVVGVADKVIKVISGIHTPDDEMKVDGVAERKIVNAVPVELVCNDSKVEASVYTNVPAQDAMHTQRVFRIRKEPVRTIIVRQTPTRNTY